MLFAIIIPLLGSLLIALFGKHKLARDFITIATSSVLFIILVLYTLGYVDIRHRLELPLIIPNFGLLFTCSLEGLVFSFMISCLWILANLYAIGYMSYTSDTHQKRFFFFFTISISSALGISFAGDLLTMFVFYELLTISTYPLIINRLSPETLAGGRTYLKFLMGSSLLLLFPAIALTYHFLGTGEFGLTTKLPEVTSYYTSSLLLFMFMYGAAKAALMPMHKWLVAAMVAQTPVSALLHAVAVVKAGVYLIIKTNFYIFGIEWVQHQYWLIFLASMTIILASISALRATHLKVRLAYSTISQLSYIILFSTISHNIMLPMAYMVLHALAKITLFFAAGAISTAAKTQEVSELKGIGKSMPWTMSCFALSAFSLIGLPFTGIFPGKVLLLSAAASHSIQLFIVGIITLSTLLNTLYFLPIIYHAFFSESSIRCSEVKYTMRLPMLITSLGNMAAFWLLFYI